MKAKVSAHMGNVFEGGADLTVLPCGAKPSWTSAVDQWIERFTLPTPRQLMPIMRLSDVTPVASFPGPKGITKFIAYGASVLNDATTVEAIESLGANIGKLTHSNPEIRIVESVLFGTGFGRLDDASAAEALTRGFRRTANAASQLWIWVFGHDRHAAVAKAVEAASIDQASPAGPGNKTKKFEDISIAVIVALAEEYKLFVQYFQGSVVERFHVGNLTIDILKRDGHQERIGLVSVDRMGNVAAAIAATRLLEVFDLDLILNVGLAAGVDSAKQSLGDIIIADKVRYYETGKLKAGRLDVAPEYADLNSTFVQSLRSADFETWPLGASLSGKPRQVFFGTVASGEKVIADDEVVRTLVGYDRKTVGIEMESYGIAAAVHGRKERFVLVRGITDFADATKSDNARLSAMEGAIRFVNEALRRGCLNTQRTTGSSTMPLEHTLTLKSRDVIGGVANNYVEVTRSRFVDDVKYRKSIIQKIGARFSLSTLRILCIELGVDFHAMTGETTIEKAASIVEFLEQHSGITTDVLGSLIDDPTESQPARDDRRADGLITIDALILKGGGVKGLAFAGALTELQETYEFKTFVGTSAGAIAAVLLAGGYSGKEIEGELKEKPFRDFLDGRILSPFKNFANGGLHPGYTFVDWIRVLLHKKLKRASDIRMKDLPKRAVVYATWRDGEVTFDSHGPHADTAAYAAVRCSMSIPFFFWRQVVDGKSVYDGGWLNNYPLSIFLNQERAVKSDVPPSFIAIYLGRDAPRSIKPRSTLAELLSGNLERNDASVIDQYRSQTILIDTDPVGTIDFDLTDDEKDLLVVQGRASTLEFLSERGLLSGPRIEALKHSRARAKELQTQVIADRVARRRRRRRLRLVAGAIAGAVILAGGYTYFTTPSGFTTYRGQDEFFTGTIARAALPVDGRTYGALRLPQEMYGLQLKLLSFSSFEGTLKDRDWWSVVQPDELAPPSIRIPRLIGPIENSTDAVSGRKSMNFAPQSIPPATGGTVLTSIKNAVVFDVKDMSKIWIRFDFKTNTNPRPAAQHNCDSSLRMQGRFNGGEWKIHSVLCGMYPGEGNAWGRNMFSFAVPPGAKTFEFAMDLSIQNNPSEMTGRYYLIDNAMIIGER